LGVTSFSGRVVVLSRQIGHYHRVRFQAAHGRVPNLHVLRTAADVEFKELAATEPFSYSISSLFESLDAFHSAICCGELMSVLSNVLTKLQPEILVLPGWGAPESYAGLVWARRSGVPVVVQSESQARDAPRNWINESLKRRFVRLCDAAHVGGPTHVDYVVGLGQSPERVFLGYDAIDNAYFWQGAEAARSEARARRKRLGLPDRYLLASGRFMEKKNFPRLIAAYAAAVSKNERTGTPDLVILGDGANRPILEAAAEEAGVGDRILFPGFRGYDVLPDYYGLADAFVHVSLIEQWGLVINEAMASGIPVIATSTAGATAALMSDGKTGYVVEPEDTRAIEVALKRIIDIDPAQRLAMGQAAAASVADWGPERFADGFADAVTCARTQTRRKGLKPLDCVLFEKLSRTELRGVP
jgi:glycosyltransferase involved in cell wall biosynthesis